MSREKWLSHEKVLMRSVMSEQEQLITKLLSCLKLIAEYKRPDGSWKHDREGCRQLALRAIDLSKSKQGRFSCDPGPPGDVGPTGIPANC